MPTRPWARRVTRRRSSSTRSGSSASGAPSGLKAWQRPTPGAPRSWRRRAWSRKRWRCGARAPTRAARRWSTGPT
ncbi:MAG: hypothetical protein M0C28_32690 [Candidatus Moduliflexus flocculans]|nr:hypothetical protein [Candidatus Moduliflexus flocculans]